MVLVLMGYDYVERCAGRYNYSKLEGLLNTITKRNADLWLSFRHGLSQTPDCATDATVIPQASHFQHLSCKRGKQYFLFPLSLYCVFNLSEKELSCYDEHNEATTEKVHPKGRQLIRLSCPWYTRAGPLCQVGLLADHWGYQV